MTTSGREEQPKGWEMGASIRNGRVGVGEILFTVSRRGVRTRGLKAGQLGKKQEQAASPCLGSDQCSRGDSTEGRRWRRVVRT